MFLRKKDKKGIVSQLVLLIGVVMSFLAVGGFLYVFFAEAEDKSVESICRASVIARTSTAIDIGVTDLNWGPLLCQTQDEEIGGSREEIKGQLAHLMANCWAMFNEGRQDDVLPPERVSTLFGLGPNKCFLCYTVTLPRAIEEGEIPAKEMFDYMVEKDHHKIKGMKYLDYIQGYGGQGYLAILDTLEPGHIYAVTYLSRQKEDSTWVTAGKTAVRVLLPPVGIIWGVNTAFSKTHFYNDKERPVSTIGIDNLASAEAGGCFTQGLES